MRLIKGKDYYDSALAYGADSSIVFVRDALVLRDRDEIKAFFEDSDITTEPHLPNFHVHETDKPQNRTHYRFLEGSSITVRRMRYDFSAVRVYLAGMVYRGVRVEISSWAGKNEDHFLWSLQSFETFLEAHGLQSMWKEADDYFVTSAVSTKTFDFLISKRISVMTYAPVRMTGFASFELHPAWTVNGDNLKLYDFSKRIDAYQCNQELSMWVGGVLPKDGPPMVEIADSVRVEKHGFDKWSFRKKPSV